jgi:ketosteroid isomerase-like protein
LPAFSSEINDVESFFKEYVAAANSYSDRYFSYYSDDAKILRVVEKPDGTKQEVDIPLERYKSEAKKTSKLAKLRKYKNKYFNVKISPCGDDYKITAMRKPSTSDYKIPAHFIVGKDENGKWKIKEESMNTKVQKFLKEN